MIVTLAACGNKCEQHVYDDCADVECNVCGDKIDSMHTWTEADCTTAKNCSVCGATEGEALGHTPSEDDGNCETSIKCVNCEQDAKAGATGHHDADHDYTCDNAGCQVTVGNPPKKKTE